MNDLEVMDLFNQQMEDSLQDRTHLKELTLDEHRERKLDDRQPPVYVVMTHSPDSINQAHSETDKFAWSEEVAHNYEV